MNEQTTTPSASARPRWFPENEHEESVYAQWRTEVAATPGLSRFRAWYEERFPNGAPASAATAA